MFNILIAEDDANIRKLMDIQLKQNGFHVIPAFDGIDALEKMAEQHVDLLVTDILMPRMDGNTLAKKARELHKDLPILMLTALESFSDKEKGFQSGTDDYMVKPVNMKELILRVKALLRRYQIVSENKFEHKGLSLSYTNNVAMVNGMAIELTKKEFLLLFKLVSNANTIFTRNQLIDEIWGFDNESIDRTVDTHIKRLREKLKCDDVELVSVRGLGYKAVLK